MKQHQDVWKTGGSEQSSLYNVFVDIHANPFNSGSWHGTSFFLPAHKYFLWVLESGLIWIAYNEGPNMNPPIPADYSCSVALPYWSWEMDYDYNPSDNVDTLSQSTLWDSKIFGSYKTGPVTDGQFIAQNWQTVLKTGNDPTSPSTPPTDNVLKRHLDTSAVPLQYDATQLVEGIVSRTEFADFTRWLEIGPHAIPHLLFGFHMRTMSSVDDFVFFFHHCNIDRLWHLWLDCHDYDKLSAAELTDTHYKALNPVSGNTPKVNPATQQPYSVGLNDKISYYWQNSDNTKIFPSEKWPTPSDLWGLGPEYSNGWDGINYRYGPDQLVNLKALKDNCGPEWVWVNFGAEEQPSSKKRDNQQLSLLNITRVGNVGDIVADINNVFDEKMRTGRMNSMQALTELANEACSLVPTMEITDWIQEWFDMNGLNPGDILRICDVNRDVSID
jgi:tyrosinase